MKKKITIIINHNNSSNNIFIWKLVSIKIKIPKIDIKPLYFLSYIHFSCYVFFLGYFSCVFANYHIFAWILAFAVLIYFAIYILIICRFFLYLLVWNIILFLVSSFWFAKSTLLWRLLSYGNCFELFDSSIKSAWFAT